MRVKELREGSHVIDLRGEDLGRIERYVINPSTRDVTHVVIEKGVFFPDERVVPVEALDQGDTQGQLRLEAAVDSDELPTFEERHYVNLDESLDEPAPYPASVWAYPAIPVGGYPAYPMVGTAPVVVDTTLNVPEGSVVVSEGAEVFADDGEAIGKVKEIGTDESGRLAYLSVNPGWFQSERMIPAHWIQSIDATGVKLALTTDALRRHDRDRS